MKNEGTPNLEAKQTHTGWENIESMQNEFDPAAAERAKQEKEELIHGAKVLAKAGFEQSHRDITESSFQKARQKGEKLPGKNNERRDLAYILRLKDMIEQGGAKAESRLWRLSANRLIIDEEDIPEAYFKSEEQALRDAGRGHELSSYEREELARDVQNKQKRSLEEWTDYLGREDAPFPLWFKVYAWDGMSKMGVFDKEKGKYAKRDKTTVAPYPGLNQAALAKTYDAITSGRSENLPENDQELSALIQAGNFVPLYTKFLLEQKAIIPTPEKTEDVHGEWVEYLPGQEKELSVAAEGTPWCIASPSMGKNYLGKDSDPENKAKFLLFHLDNPRSGQLSESACASIRLNSQGKVAEISGLDNGQALEDSLVPIVEDKCSKLPGGKKFLKAFADKRELIRIDRKMQDGEELTDEELRFAYEIDRPIHTLDTYNYQDPRLTEIREKYGISRAAEITGISGIKIFKKMTNLDYLDSIDISRNFDEFLKAGASAEFLAQGIEGEDAIDNLQKLLANRSVDIHEIIDKIPGDTTDRHFEELLSLGASKDEVAKNLSGFSYRDGSRAAIEKLISIGMNIEQVVEKMQFSAVGNNLDNLLALGANPNQLGKGIQYRIEDVDKLITAGADIDEIIANIQAPGVSIDPKEFIERGADPSNLGKTITSAEDLRLVLSEGADINHLIHDMQEGTILNLFNDLIDYSANPKTMASRLGQSDRGFFRYLMRERRRNQRALRRSQRLTRKG